MSERGSTREALLEEAIRVLETDGESAIRMREVAAACGVTSPIIYKAFGSRDGLVAAAHAERFRRAIDSITDPIATAVAAATTREELRSVIEQLAAAFQAPERAPLRRMQFAVMGAAVHDPVLHEAVDAALRSLIDRSSAALRLARDRGLVRADVAIPEAVWWFFGQVQGRHLVEQTAAPVDHDAWNRTSTRALLDLLFGD